VAPEVLEDTKYRRYNHSVDIWSLGVVLYICLCGYPPFSDELFTAENPYTLTQQIKMGRFDYQSPYWDTIPDAALDLIDRMLTVNVEGRATTTLCLGHMWTMGDKSLWENPPESGEYGPEARGKPCRHEVLAGEVFYRCRTRGAENFALCESCYFASDHEGHRWSRDVRESNMLGSFCDCSDAKAFTAGVALKCAIHGVGLEDNAASKLTARS
jgi:serine/threonine protein kinase